MRHFDISKMYLINGRGIGFNFWYLIWLILYLTLPRNNTIHSNLININNSGNNSNMQDNYSKKNKNNQHQNRDNHNIPSLTIITTRIIVKIFPVHTRIWIIIIFVVISIIVIIIKVVIITTAIVCEIMESF